MAQRESNTLVLSRGEAKALVHTLSTTRHLSLALIACDAGSETATFELRNPEAEPDSTVSGLVEEAVEDVDTANEWRDKFHLPEKAVPVDTSTVPVQRLECRLHEKLQIGDRVWTLSEIGTDRVALTPGHDHEDHTLVNKVEDLEYSAPVINAADALNAVDEVL
jgi:hypothetical protein